MGWQDAPIVKPAAKTKAAWEDAPIVKPAAQEKKPLTLAGAAFPSSQREYAPRRVMTPYGNAGYPQEGGRLPENAFRTQGQGEQRLMAGAMDALSLPARAAGTMGGLLGYSGATGGKEGLEALADPETGLMRPARQASGGLLASGMSGGEDGNRGLLDYGKMAAGGAGYLAASVAEDPFAIVGGLAKAAPKMVGKLAKKTASPAIAAAQSIKGKTAGMLEGGANRIQNTIIRPRQVDELAGFKIGNVSKYGLQGSLDEVITKSQSQIDDAAKNLKALIKQGKDDGARVDLNQAVQAVQDEIMKGGGKEFANLKESPGALKDLRERIALLADAAPGGKADLVEAQYVKQALGDMGAFEHIAGKQGVQISKDDRALSQIASRVYLKLKDQIEAVAPAGVKEQNRIMSELIPVNRASLYRKLVADRNNVVSMNDMLGAMATIGGGPQGLALWAASRASKSGNTAKVMFSAAKALKSAKTPAEASFYAKRLQSLGATAAEIEAIRAASEAIPNSIPFRKVAEDDKKQPKIMALR